MTVNVFSLDTVVHGIIFAVCCVCLQVCELQEELSELEKCNWELEDDVEMKKAANAEEISRLEVRENHHQRSVHLFRCTQ